MLGELKRVRAPSARVRSASAGRGPSRGAAEPRARRGGGTILGCIIGSVALLGCGDDTGDAGAGGDTATTTATATGGGMGDGGAGGGLPAGCTPTEGVAIDATCGLFVEAGATGDGSQADPMGSIAEAAQNLAGKQAIYVCGADTLSGSVDLPGGVSLFGGLDCASWTYGASNSKPTLLGDADSIALRISGSGTSTVQSMRVEAPNAVAAGASTNAVLVEDATLTRMEPSERRAA